MLQNLVMRSQIPLASLALCLCSTPLSHTQPTRPLDGVHGPQRCATDFQGLVKQLLPELPSYANRAYTRAGQVNRYMVIASQPNFEPLPPPQSHQTQPALTIDQQVFFTTLIRRYQDQAIQNFQTYHWLFLTPMDTGWQFSKLYSSRGAYPQVTPPAPPQDRSDGALAMAVRAWLRDCRSRHYLSLEVERPALD